MAVGDRVRFAAERVDGNYTVTALPRRPEALARRSGAVTGVTAGRRGATTIGRFAHRSRHDRALSSLVNHQVRLARRPVGLPTADDWQFTTEPVAEPGEGGVLVKTLALSLDPAMRGWMNEGKSYIPPVGIGEVMRAGGVGVVIASQQPGLCRRRPRHRRPGRAGVLHRRRRPDQAQRPGQDRPAPGHARRSGSTCWACRA